MIFQIVVFFWNDKCYCYLFFQCIFYFNYCYFGNVWMVGDIFFNFVCFQLMFGNVNYIVSVFENKVIIVSVMDVLVKGGVYWVGKQ